MKLEREDVTLGKAQHHGHAPREGQHPLDPTGGAANGKRPKNRKKSESIILDLRTKFTYLEVTFHVTLMKFNSRTEAL